MDTNPALTQQASRGREDPVVTGLVTRARNGEQQAWDALIDRYAPLIWSICRRNRLEAADAQDVWLKLVGQLDKIRDPAALPGWPSPPGANAAASRARRGGPATPGMRSPPGPSRTITPRQPGRTCSPPNGTQPGGQLPPGCQQLLALLTEDPALSYAEISARLGIPAGSIGPTRRHCLDELRRHPAITALINPDT